MNLLFAIVDDALPVMPRVSRDAINAWIVVGAILFVVVVVFGWAAFIRKRRKRKHRHHRSMAKAAAAGVNEIRRQVHERQRRRRTRQRQRNPTLAETGGLPPVRADVSQPPS
jgi:type VI protein secretion system component VasK